MDNEVISRMAAELLSVDLEEILANPEIGMSELTILRNELTKLNKDNCFLRLDCIELSTKLKETQEMTVEAQKVAKDLTAELKETKDRARAAQEATDHMTTEACMSMQTSERLLSDLQALYIDNNVVSDQMNALRMQLGNNVMSDLLK